MNEDTFTINNEEIDVTKIMEQIRENIKKRNMPDEELPDLNEIRTKLNNASSEVYNKDELEQNIRLNNMRWNIILDKPITSHRKYIGKYIVFCKRILRKILKWHMESLFGQQIEFNSSVTRSLNEINNFVKSTEERLSNYEKQVKELISIIEEKEKKIAYLEKSLHDEKQKVGKKIDEIKESSDRGKFNENLYLKLSELKDEIYENKINFDNELKNIKDEIMKNKRKRNLNNARLKRLEKRLKNIKDTCDYSKESQEEYKFDYFLFENKFRGKEENIKEKFRSYVHYFEGKQNVLDIGCGRGEFLELLTEKGISCKGIDINQDMYLYCKKKGLNVEQIDMFAYLKDIDNRSLGGIFLGQVIEHLPIKDIIKLVRLAYQKLQSGAYFIAETINPQCLLVFTDSYFLDPFHIKLVHPETIKFILEMEGFNNIEIMYTSKVDENLRIPKLEFKSGEDIDEFNNSIEKLNDIIYGYRDYAIIGRK